MAADSLIEGHRRSTIMNKIKSVLLIEDDPITNFINERLIKKVGLDWEIKVALNGFDALASIRQKYDKEESIPSLILLDLNMPVMDGFEFLDKFNKLDIPDKEKVIVIVLTTSTHAKDMNKLNNSGNTDFINKPLTEEKMRNILEKYFSEIELK